MKTINNYYTRLKIRFKMMYTIIPTRYINELQQFNNNITI